MNIKKNYFYMFSYQLIISFIPIVTAPYVSRILGVEGVGRYSYIYSITHYFFLFAYLGLNNYGTRSIAKIKNDDFDKLNETFSSIYLQQIIISLFIIIIYVLFIVFFVKDFRNLFLINAIYLISVFLSIDWVYYGLEKFKTITLRNLIVKIFVVISIFIFVNKKEDLWKYVLILSIRQLLSKLILFLQINKHVVFKKVSIKNSFSHFNSSLILFVPVIATSVIRYMDKIMLGLISNISEVGFYSNAEKIVFLLVGFITVLGRVSMPRVANYIEENKIEKANESFKNSFKFVMGFSFALAFGVSAISREFIPLFYGYDFMESSRILKVLSFTLIFIAIANVVRTQYIIPKGYDEIYVKSIVIAGIINLILNVILIPKFGAMGAVVGTLVAEFFVAIYQIYRVRVAFNFLKLLSGVMIYFFSGLMMFIIVNLIGIKLGISLLTLIVQIMTGGIIYITICAIYLYIKKDPFLLMLEKVFVKKTMKS